MPSTYCSPAPNAPEAPVQSQPDHASSGHTMTAVERLVMRLTAKSEICSRRRRNYEQLFEGLSGLPNCRPIFADLPKGVVPYLFPLWIESLPHIFSLLEDCGVPMQRFGQFLWHTFEETDCPVSTSYSHHVVQFPCHQDLSSAELESLIAQVRAAISARPPV